MPRITERYGMHVPMPRFSWNLGGSGYRASAGTEPQCKEQQANVPQPTTVLNSPTDDRSWGQGPASCHLRSCLSYWLSYGLKYFLYQYLTEKLKNKRRTKSTHCFCMFVFVWMSGDSMFFFPPCKGLNRKKKSVKLCGSCCITDTLMAEQYESRHRHHEKEWAWVPINLYLQKQAWGWIWAMVCRPLFCATCTDPPGKWPVLSLFRFVVKQPLSVSLSSADFFC